VNERLVALKDGKRVVELRYQNILVEKSEQNQKIEIITQQSELHQVKNQSLEERLLQLENEKTEQTEILADIQQSLIQKTSEYESQMLSMQVELDNRLDEINLNKKEDVDKVKGHYIELFDEKASEVLSLRNDLERSNCLVVDYKRKCTDLEYREEELNDLVNKMRTDPIKTEESDLKNQLDASFAQTVLMKERLDTIKTGFEEIKMKEKIRLDKFESSIERLHSVIIDKDEEILKLTSNINKENTLEVVNLTESHSSHKQCTDVVQIDNTEDGKSSKMEMERKVKNKRRKKKNRNL